MSAPPTPTAHHFWRDASLPFIEARAIVDGRKVRYAKHAHETFSIGVIRSGRTDYINQGKRQGVGPGSVVLMNPGDVHGCNPFADEPWSYRMMYVDHAWLGRLQHGWGFSANQDFRPFAATMSTAPALYDGFNRFFDVLTDAAADPLLRQCASVAFFEQVQSSLDPAARVERDANRKLERAAEYISDNCTAALKLEDICAAADLSPSYLIRAFRKRYGMTPHAYLLNRRVQRARGLLKGGGTIADVALATGFSDQAHFQRTFKQFLAATPGQYRR
ncbi:AraC family transcriptional regulator [Duganella sp. FT3S]|uniref:AraC family transcriptional regulator n=1 Tax=Rugamonas fusca TaxID=2758568 RepID=A0A7W2EF20_9BURK|nr:AraC family transcriptional regulator [Rugamonas fusca]MBA5604741.1 AraC family transcriptional regulator [Rugamonas fusca]